MERPRRTVRLREIPRIPGVRTIDAIRAIGAEAMQQVRRMLAVTTRVDDGFSEMDLMGALATFADGTTDADDAILTEMCQRHGCALVTDDGDFRFGGIRVITGNRRLLAACS